jgi:hypothetical protein
MSDKKKFILRTHRTSESLVVSLSGLTVHETTPKRSPATDKEALFEWAENFVRRYDKDFEELAKR